MGSFYRIQVIPIKFISKFKGPAACLLAAVIWGLSFVAQKTGANIGTFTFNGIRTFMGGLVLLPIVIIGNKKENNKQSSDIASKPTLKATLIGGTVCGVVLFVASNLQQHAFTYDIAAGKVGFITALYMILVPLTGLFFKKIPKPNVWIAAVFGIAGLYLLCLQKGDTAIGKGELFAFLCAIMFAAHILVIDYYCDKLETIPLACTQFLVAGGISIVCMFIFEEPKMSEILDQAIPILYAGIGSSACAFTLQIYGQKTTEPAVASLLFCLESVFSVIFGLFFGDHLAKRAMIGCAVMFAGVVISQLDISALKKGKEATVND